jgi:hypothetical protein
MMGEIMNQTTVEQLNRLQADWMALQADDPEKVRKAVLGRMADHYPKTYVSVSSDLAYGMPMIDGMPVWPSPRSTAEAVGYLRGITRHRGDRGVRLDVGWCGSKGEWVTL